MRGSRLFWNLFYPLYIHFLYKRNHKSEFLFRLATGESPATEEEIIRLGGSA